MAMMPWEIVCEQLRSQFCMMPPEHLADALRIIRVISVEPTPTKRLGEKQAVVRDLRDLVSPDLTPHGASIEIIQKINAYKGWRWSIDVENRREPKDQEQRLIHKLLILIGDKALPDQKTFYRWLL